jgi:hypothetical protein
MADPLIEASCHCGTVRFAVAAAPQQVTDCNCSICRRYGVLWAYYAPRQVQFLAGEGATEIYMCGDRELEFHRCRTCGCVTHWAPVAQISDRMGVNARLMPPASLAHASTRRLDGAGAWDFVEDRHPIWWTDPASGE